MASWFSPKFANSIFEKTLGVKWSGVRADWINRTITINYKQIIYPIDWAMRADVSVMRQERFQREHTPAQQWYQQQVECLWHGRMEEVVKTLHSLDWEQIDCKDIRNSPAYFVTHKAYMDFARLRQEGYQL